MQNPGAASLHVMPPKQSQVQGMPPMNSSSGSWFGMGSVRQSQAVQSYPDGYPMCPGANGNNARSHVFYEGRAVQKIPHGHVPDYGRAGMIPSQVQPNGFMANGLVQRNFSPDDMMMDSSISRQLSSPVDQHMIQANNPGCEDLYPDPRMRGGWRPMYPPQYDPVPGMQDPAMGPLEGARPPAMGPGLLMASSDMNQDMMVCRMSGEGGVRGSPLLAQHPSAYYGSQQRVLPYPNPQQYMQNKRAQYNARRKSSQDTDPAAMKTYVSNGWYGNGGWPRQPYPQQPMVLQNNYPYADAPCHGKDGGGPYLTATGVPARSHCQTERWQLSQTSREPAQCNNAFSPPPGNPTPPMTPGSTSMPPCHLPVDPVEVRQGSQRSSLRENEPYFTFAVREGMIKLPFQLEHNLPVSCHIFNLHDQVHESLMSRSDFELMLKCFHKEDRSMSTNWPATVSISLNEVPLLIERGNALFTRHQPVFLKSICKPGQNTLQISVKTCCCSHLFVLQIVHRPSLRSVLHGLVSKRLLPAQHSVSKIKRVVSQHPTSMTSDGLSNEQQPYLLPLTCPISRQRVHLPSRGQECRHIECFDLESYLKMNCEHNQWICPICKKMAVLDSLEVDQYIWGILVHLSNTCFDTVVFDASATWKPVPKSGIDCGNDANLCKNFISVNSMVLPNPSTHLTSRSSLSGALPPPGAQVNISKEMGAHREYRQRPGGPTEAPDYLGCLSHMTDVFLGSDNAPTHNVPHSTTNNNNNNNNNNSLEHVSFPPTPVGSQISTICTPLDGQSLHPRTPSDGNATHPHTPPDGHPFTPLDSQSSVCSSSSSKPSPENCGSAGVGTPRTPSAACDSLSSGRQAAGTGVADGSSGAGKDSGVKKEPALVPDQSQSCPAVQCGSSSSGTANPKTEPDLGDWEPPLFGPDEDDVGLFSLVFDDDPADLTSYLGPNHNNNTADGSSALASNNKGADSDDDFLSFLS